MKKSINTVIVGAGQAGLSISYYLKQSGRDHLIVEQGDQVGVAWRNRWDSFTLITPNWMIRLPGAEYSGNDPDGFLPRKEVIALFEDYVERYKIPVQFGSQVTSVELLDHGYLVKIDQDELKASNVVIATGMFQEPKIPPFSAQIAPDITQLHSHEYRNPEQLPAGAVLVVGSAQSGAQIAEELYQSGRKVYLSVSRAGRLPRRYRGRDATRWMEDIGIAKRTAKDLPSPKAKFAGSAHATGKDGGRTINLHQFARDGVTLLGRIMTVQEYQVRLGDDLTTNLANADRREAEFVKAVDKYIKENGLELPPEELPQLRDGFEAEEIRSLDLTSAGIRTIIWATGFKFDYSLVKLPVTDEDGYPIQNRGVTDYPGLYFIGMPFLHNIKSGLLAGVGDDAKYLASVIESRG